MSSCIKTLRQALGERGRTPHFLRTLHGQGYRFVAAVEERERGPRDDEPHALTQVSGKGFLALFGAPLAQEDHARWAVSAAFELRQRLRAPHAVRGQSHSVVVRQGLHSGPVVVGPLADEPRRPYVASGDTLQLATQLQQRAAPDAILVSTATYALVQDEVQGEVYEPLPLDGPSTQAPVYAIHGLQRRRAGVPRHGS